MITNQFISKSKKCLSELQGVSELQLWSKWKSETMSVFSKDNIEECEHVTEMIRELSRGINDFSMPEITDILAYTSTN